MELKEPEEPGQPDEPKEPVELKEPEEPGQPDEPEKPEEPEEDPGWDEWPPDGNNRPLPSRGIGHVGVVQRTRWKRMPLLRC